MKNLQRVEELLKNEIYKLNNIKQIGAINNVNGVTYVVAGPGTGKTKIIVLKAIKIIVRLLKEKRDINKLLVCTFTEKATEEIKYRVQNYIDKLSIELNIADLNIKTIHGFCKNLLEKYHEILGINANFRVMDEVNQLMFIFNTIENYYIYNNKSFSKADMLAGYFNKIVDKLIDIDKIIENIEFSEDEKDQKLYDLLKSFKIYQLKILEKNLIDFAHLQYIIYENLYKNKKFKELVKKEVDYILIDEYQDTNNLQDKILREIIKPNNNITVVGDDDQSLYRFRGTTITNFLNFKNYYKDDIINEEILEKNYRSYKSHIDFYSEFVKNNIYDRINKKLIDVRKNNNKYPIIINIQENEESEAVKICEIIKYLFESKKVENYCDIAILFKSVTYHADKYIKELDNHNIPIEIATGRGFLETREVLKVVTILEYLHTNDLDIIIGRIDNQGECEDIENKIYRIKDRFNGFNHLEIYYLILEEFDILNNAKKNDIRALAALSEIINDFSEQIDEPDIFNLIQFIYFLQRQHKDKYSQSNKNAVFLSTIHQSKGLEFPVVILPSLEKRKLPTERFNLISSLDKENVIREDNFTDLIRLYYVAMSRAQDLLILSSNYEKKFNEIFLKTIENQAEKIISYNDIIIKDVTINSIRKRVLPHKYSFTSLSTYKMCPRLYLLTREYRFKTKRTRGLLFGDIIHKILAEINKDHKNNNCDELVDKYWIDDKIWGKDTEKFKKYVKKRINEYLKQKYFKFEEVTNVEELIYKNYGDFTIQGYIDLIYSNNNEYSIIDFKTGKYDEELIKFQLYIYSDLFEYKFNIKPRKIGIYSISDNKIDIHDYSENEKDLYIKKIYEIHENITKNIYPKNLDRCKKCDFNKIC